MIDKPVHWTSKALVLFGMWLWKEKEYGHALLCLHAPHWGLKIGTQLSITWDDVINSEDGSCKQELWIRDKETPHRLINPYIKETLETAYAELPIKNIEDEIYMNYRTGRPLTSSTLNRELQKHSHQFIWEMRNNGVMLPEFKELKSNAFEIAWAMDMVKKYNYSKQVFSAVSSFMGHRSVKDTIKLLELEPIDKIEFEFDNVSGMPHFKEFDSLNLKQNIWKYTHL
jgi:hypothetical protein